MDPYLTLGVSKDCNREEVKEAFRVRVLLVHPDHGGEQVSFIQLRTAYEQILAELDQDSGPNAASHDGAARDESRPVPAGSRVVAGTYESWIRQVAAQADRKRSVWRSTRIRAIGLAIIAVILIANLAAFWFIWSREPVPNQDIPVVEADTREEPERAAVPIRIVTNPAATRRWQQPPAYHPDFFVIPYNATLYLAPVRGYRGDSTEFGIVTSQGDFLTIFTGLPGRPNPPGEVGVGPVDRGSKLRIYLKKNGSWVFSDATSSEPSSESFWDRDNSLGGNGSIIERTGEATWVLHLDDIGSTDDDDKDILIQVRLGRVED